MATWKKVLTDADIYYDENKKTFDYGSNFNSLNSAGEFCGEVISHGATSGTYTAGKIYALSATWTLADKDNVADGKKQLGVATGTTSSAMPTNGMLIKGLVSLSASIGGTGEIGDVVYLADGGAVSYDAPTAAGDIIRPIGYSVNELFNTIFFDPDKTWVELS
mgnify:CR=1 FL=1